MPGPIRQLWQEYARRRIDQGCPACVVEVLEGTFLAAAMGIAILQRRDGAEAVLEDMEAEIADHIERQRGRVN